MTERGIRPEAPPLHWPSVAQFALSALAAVTLLGTAASFALVGLQGLIRSGPVGPGAASMFMLAAALALIAVLLLPSAAYGLARLLGRELSAPLWLAPLGHWFRPSLAILLFPLVLLAGYAVSANDSLSWWLLPPLHVLAVGLPVLWLGWLALRSLPSGSPQRFWGALNSGLVLAPALALVLELLAILVYLIIAVVLLLGSPEVVDQFEALSLQLPLIDPSNEAELTRLLAPFLVQPGVLLAVLSFLAVVVPLIEELLKPIGVWLLVGRRLAPAEGFAIGALGGAGFALFETLTSVNTPDGWAAIVAARLGTNVMHLLTSGLMGWALASAWAEKRWLRLGAAYLLAVALHGIWNAAAVLVAFGSLSVGHAGWSLPEYLPVTASIFLFVFALLAFSSLLLYNRRLRRTAAEPTGPEEHSA